MFRKELMSSLHGKNCCLELCTSYTHIRPSQKGVGLLSWKPPSDTTRETLIGACFSGNPSGCRFVRLALACLWSLPREVLVHLIEPLELDVPFECIKWKFHHSFSLMSMEISMILTLCVGTSTTSGSKGGQPKVLLRHSHASSANTAHALARIMHLHVLNYRVVDPVRTG